MDGKYVSSSGQRHPYPKEIPSERDKRGRDSRSGEAVTQINALLSFRKISLWHFRNPLKGVHFGFKTRIDF